MIAKLIIRHSDEINVLDSDYKLRFRTQIKTGPYITEQRVWLPALILQTGWRIIPFETKILTIQSGRCSNFLLPHAFETIYRHRILQR